MIIMFLMGGSHDNSARDDYPLYLTEMNGKLILEQQVEYCEPLKPSQTLFCIQANDMKRYRVDSVIYQLLPSANIIPLASPTKGAVCTALLGSEYIDKDEELILMAIDDLIEDQGEQALCYFRESKCDAGVVAFRSVHPRYSFAKADEDNCVYEVAEKTPISRNALVSFYYFKKGSDFVTCAKNVIRKDNPVGDSFYISQTLNEMILCQKKVVMHTVPNEKFHPLKTEAQLAQYLSELGEAKSHK